jgi:hypothetical protein
LLKVRVPLKDSFEEHPVSEVLFDPYPFNVSAVDSLVSESPDAVPAPPDGSKEELNSDSESSDMELSVPAVRNDNGQFRCGRVGVGVG